MDGFIGYDEDQAKVVSKTIDTSAQEACKTIVDKLKRGLVIPMSTCWYTPEGVNFFKALASDVENTGVEIKKIFDSFIDTLEKTVNAWADTVGADHVSLSPIGECVLKLDVSSIQKSNGTAMGAKEEEARSVANKLSIVESDIKSELHSIAGKLDSNEAFIGRGQGQAINECFDKISDIVSDIFKFLTQGDNNVKSNIDKAIDKYGDLAKQVTTNYQGNVGSKK